MPVLTLSSPLTDTYISAANATTNYVTADPIRAGESNAATNNTRLLIQFDLVRALPDKAVITGASIFLYCVADFANNARTWSMYRILKSVIYASVTWNKYDGTNDWGTAGGFNVTDCDQTTVMATRDFTATETTSQYKEFPITSAPALELLRCMARGCTANNGFLIRAATENADMYHFSSMEAASNKPYMTITYTVPPAYRTHRGVDLKGRHGRRLIY